ncbi:hypothetical protein IIB79_13020, partial [candidate division KSB1 bacterium]|nr:hypothetical protein [candidate division KSB1 bacterium]
YGVRGKKIVHYNLKKERPSKEETAEFFLGRTGNFRAPALRSGRTLVVGFNEEIYEKVFLKAT